MSNLPKDWELVQLNDIVKFSNGKGHEQYIDDNGDYIVVNSKFISTNGEICKYSNENLSPLKKGDITLVMSDIPNGRALAKCYLIEEDNKYTLNQRICSLEAKNDNKEFLFYKLNRNQYFLKFNDGVNQTNLRKNEVLECPIELPPLEEQKKIADILSTVDKKIAFVEENINATEELKKGLMQKLLTEGIGHTEFKDTTIGKIPSSWEVVKLAEAIDIMTDYVANGSFASLAENVNVYDEPNYAIYVRLFDLRKGLGHSEQKYVDEESYKFLSKSYLEGREILIANIGANVGETFLMPYINKPATLAPNMIEVKVDQEKLISEFLYFYLTGHIGLKELEKVTEGSGQPKINKTKLKTINVPIPSLKEQSQIIKILSTVDNKLENLKEKKQYFEELKKGLMQKLLTGEIRV